MPNQVSDLKTALECGEADIRAGRTVPYTADFLERSEQRARAMAENNDQRLKILHVRTLLLEGYDDVAQGRVAPYTRKDFEEDCKIMDDCKT